MRVVTGLLEAKVARRDDRVASAGEQRRQRHCDVVIKVEGRHAGLRVRGKGCCHRHLIGPVGVEPRINQRLVPAIICERRLHRFAWNRILGRDAVHIAVDGREVANERPDRDAGLLEPRFGQPRFVRVEFDMAFDQLRVVVGHGESPGTKYSMQRAEQGGGATGDGGLPKPPKADTAYEPCCSQFLALHAAKPKSDSIIGIITTKRERDGAFSACESGLQVTL